MAPYIDTSLRNGTRRGGGFTYRKTQGNGHLFNAPLVSLSARTSNGSCFKAPFSCLPSVGVGVHFKVLYWHPLQMCCLEGYLLCCELGTKGEAQEHLINAHTYGLLEWNGCVRVSLFYSKKPEGRGIKKKKQFKWLFYTVLWATAFPIWRIMWLLFLSL